MKAIKLMLIVAAFGLSGTIMAQNDVKPTFENDGDKIKGTYYYENGKVQQVGTYKDGKLHGEWISYDKNGNKTAVAQYENGWKTGKWIFWNGNKVTEVDYNDNRVAAVNILTNNDSEVVSNP